MTLFNFQNIRTRLTVRYTLVSAVLLFLYALSTSLFLYFYLLRQIDQNLREDLEIIQDLLVNTSAFSNQIESEDSTHYAKRFERFIEIWDTAGVLIYRSSALGKHALGNAPSSDELLLNDKPRSVTFDDRTRWRLISIQHAIRSRNLFVRIAMSEEHVFEQMNEFMLTLLFSSPFVLLVAAIGGYVLARRALVPIDRMVTQAKKITAENLKERLLIDNPQDELGHLATVINDLLNRIEVSFEQLQRFTADASHELRTPLTAMRSVGEVGLQDGQSPSHYREVIGSMLEDNNRLTHLVDSLLLLSKADSGRIELHREQIELITFVTETTELISILADEKGQALDVTGERQVFVFADKVLFRQALLNLIDNAIKYTPTKGRIRLGVSSESDNTAIINVADSGPGIPPEDHEKIFNRFYRVDKVRSRETGGAGLGLAIVRWIVTAHQGTVTLQSSHTGSTFRISIPRSS